MTADIGVTIALPATEYLSRLEGLLGAAAHLEVVRLTDEELTVLDGSGAEQVVPRPWFLELSEDQRDTALAVALQGLAVRGLAVPTIVEESGVTIIGLPDDVAAVLSARRAASAVLIAQRRSLGSSATRVLYLQGSELTVEEEVSPGGLHALAVASLGEALDRLVSFTDPETAAQHDGPAVEVDLREVAAGRASVEAAERALWTTVLTAVLPAGPGTAERSVSIHALPDSVVVARPRNDAPISDVWKVSARSLRAILDDLLRPLQ